MKRSWEKSCDFFAFIEKVYENGELAIRYQYDALNRLIREDNKVMSTTVLYSYDNNGNILKQRKFAFTLKNIIDIEELESEDKVYIYDGDKLLSFNGEECAYNETTGMQTKYRGKSLGWTNRRVSSYKGIEFSYDGQGRRIAKGNISYIYDSQNRLLKQSNGLEFFYDQSGVSSVKYAGNIYFYRKDILGNIIALIDTNGSVVVKYSYNAWGYNGVSDINGTEITDENHIGNLNPFRYRGYYYDTETKLYYLKTRYYDPETGRFISQDGIDYIDPDTINGLNLYAYCFNNPIGLCDPSGCSALAALIIGLLLLFTPVGGTVWQITASVLGYAGIAIASLFDKDIKNDMDSIGWNPFNADESLVTGSTKVSFYKGAPVFRTNATRSWSFGAIFFVKGHTANVLKHERGHNWQLMMMGLATYGFTVAIPSSLELGKWAALPNGYYKAPWEALASILGGDTSRGLTKDDISTAWWYYGLSHLLIPSIFFWFK